LVKNKIANIYDILEYVRGGMPQHKPLKFFDSVPALGVYSYSSVPSKVYPKDKARKGALKFVLQDIGHYKKMKKNPGRRSGRGDESTGHESAGTGLAAEKKRKKKTKKAGGSVGRGNGSTGHGGVGAGVPAEGGTNSIAGQNTTPAVVSAAQVEEQR
jgi:hypothetical protein